MDAVIAWISFPVVIILVLWFGIRIDKSSARKAEAYGGNPPESWLDRGIDEIGKLVIGFVIFGIIVAGVSYVWNSMASFGVIYHTERVLTDMNV